MQGRLVLEVDVVGGAGCTGSWGTVGTRGGGIGITPATWARCQSVGGCT